MCYFNHNILLNSPYAGYSLFHSQDCMFVFCLCPRCFPDYHTHCHFAFPLNTCAMVSHIRYIREETFFGLIALSVSLY